MRWNSLDAAGQRYWYYTVTYYSPEQFRYRWDEEPEGRETWLMCVWEDCYCALTPADLVPFFSSPDPEIRMQAIRIMGYVRQAQKEPG